MKRQRVTYIGTTTEDAKFHLYDEDRGFGEYAVRVKLDDSEEIVWIETSSDRFYGLKAGSRIEWTQATKAPFHYRFRSIEPAAEAAPVEDSREQKIEKAMEVCEMMGAPITREEAARRVDAIAAGKDWTK